MNAGRWMWGLVVVGVLGVAGCASGPAADEKSQGKLSLRDGATLDGAPCGLEAPVCPTGLTCASLDLDTGTRGLCVDPWAVCEQLQCGRGACAVLESHPVQIRCEG